MSSADPALEVRNLTKQYDTVTAVNDLSFEVYEGEVFGLLGPNGSGKTTTIRTIMDIFRPDSGEVCVLGEPPGTSRTRTGYMPEERSLYDNLRVMEMLVYLARLKGVVDGPSARRRAGSLLESEQPQRRFAAEAPVRRLPRTRPGPAHPGLLMYGQRPGFKRVLRTLRRG